jgi:hypothetical protein
MKVKDQNISGSLGVLLRKLMKSSKNNSEGIAVSRETKATRTTKSPRKKGKNVTDVERAVDALIAYQKENGDPQLNDMQRLEEISALKRGDFSSGYWQKCDLSTEVSLYCIPAHSPYTGQRNYSYPDPAYEPSILTYGEGIETVGNPRLDGMMISGAFRETMYKWKRYTFDLPNTVTTQNQETTFFKVWGPVLGTASEQAGRAMLSVVMKVWIVSATSARLTTYEPPTTKPINDWYKYRTPRGAPPYWEATRVMSVSRTALAKGYIETPGNCTKAVVLVGPAPTKGWRFNNNDTVACELQPVVEMWQIKKENWIIGTGFPLEFNLASGCQIAWGSNKYLYLDMNARLGAYGVWTSANNLSWSFHAIPNLQHYAGTPAVIYAFGKWIAAQYDQNWAYALSISEDGLNWTFTQDYGNPPLVSNFCLMNGILVAQILGSDYVYTTTDGETYEEVNTGLNSNYGIGSIAHNGRVFLVIQDRVMKCAKSSDGINWTHYGDVMSGWFYAVKAIGFRFIAVARNSTTAAYSDNDGQTWTAITLPFANYWAYMISDGKKIDLFSYTNTSRYLTTTDGIIWTEKTLPVPLQVRSSIFSNKFALMTAGYNTAVSTKG